jgi:hypothetical protein
MDCKATFINTGYSTTIVLCSFSMLFSIHRRNALAEPFQLAMNQEIRERIQKEVADRNTSVTSRVSQYFKAFVSDDYEVDLA